MKKLTKKILDTQFSGNKNKTEFNEEFLSNLFKLFLQYEQDSNSDPKNLYNDFVSYLEGSKNEEGKMSYFYPLLKERQKLTEGEDSELPIYYNTYIKKAVKPLRPFFDKHFIGYQEQFVDVATSAKCPQTKEVLEVGSGFGTSTFLLSKRFNRPTTCMDRDSISMLPKTSLQKLGIKFVRKPVNENTDLSLYDLVLAKNACTAIIPIVMTQTKNENQFLMQLCDCKAPDHSDPFNSFVKLLQKKATEISKGKHNLHFAIIHDRTLFKDCFSTAKTETSDICYVFSDGLDKEKVFSQIEKQYEDFIMNIQENEEADN